MTRANIRKIALLVFVSRLLTFIVFPKPVYFPDSPGYSNGKFLNFDLVSLSGQSLRAWPTPLLYSILPNINFISASQLLISGLAWFWLILNSVALLNTKRYQIILLFTMLLFSSSTFLIQWDTVALGTSLLISTTVLVVAQLLRVLRNSFNSIDIGILICLVILLSIEKFSNIPLSIGISITLIIAAAKQMSKKSIAAISAFAFIGLSYSIMVGSNVDRSWSGSYSGTTLLWQLGDQSPVAQSFKDFLATKPEVPPCIYVAAPYQDLNSSIGEVLNSCDEGLEYIRLDLQKNFIMFAISHPFQIVKLSSLGFGAYFTNSANNYGNAVQITPDTFNSFIFGGTRPSLNSGAIQDQSEGYSAFNSGEPFWLYVPGLGLLFAGWVTSVANIRRSQNKSIDISILAITALLLFQATITTTFLPSEWVRQLAPYLIPLAAINVLTVVTYFERKSNSFGNRSI